VTTTVAANPFLASCIAAGGMVMPIATHSGPVVKATFSAQAVIGQPAYMKAALAMQCPVLAMTTAQRDGPANAASRRSPGSAQASRAGPPASNQFADHNRRWKIPSRPRDQHRVNQPGQPVQSRQQVLNHHLPSNALTLRRSGLNFCHAIAHGHAQSRS